jgi:hypothetical protein
MAIHSYREKKEEKAVDVVVATTIYPYIFFFFLLFLVFSCRIITRNQKKNRCTNTFRPLFSLRIGQSEDYSCSLIFEEHRERKKKEGKHQLQNR